MCKYGIDYKEFKDECILAPVASELIVYDIFHLLIK